MSARLPFIALSLIFLALVGCDRADKIASGTEPGVGGIGSARLTLPELPGDSSTDSAIAAEFRFELTISGEAMVPVRRSWALAPGRRDTALIGNIPAGYMRKFAGRLFRIDTVRMDTVVTHEGLDSAYIPRDSVVPVRLFLGKKPGSGSARICIEVEGWPSDSSCIKPPEPVHPPADSLMKAFIGCWQVSFQGQEGTLSVGQVGNDLYGVLRWADRSVDSLSGVLEYPYLRLTTEGAHGNRKFVGNVLSRVNHFEVKLLDTPHRVIETLVGERSACGIINVPDPTVPSVIRTFPL